MLLLQRKEQISTERDFHCLWFYFIFLRINGRELKWMDGLVSRSTFSADTSRHTFSLFDFTREKPLKLRCVDGRNVTVAIRWIVASCSIEPATHIRI